MSVSNVAPAIMAAQQGATKPNLLSLVQGELFKLVHNRGVWITALIILPVMVVWGFHYIGILSLTSALQGQFITPGQAVYTASQSALADVRGFSGIFLTVITVIAIGLEYQQGTIRVLLARGVGRMRLLTAKLVAVGIIGVVFLPVMLLVVSIMTYVDLNLSGHVDWLNQLPDYFWSDAGIYLYTILISMFATILLAATITVLGRSLAIGFSLSLPWFLLESLVGGILLVTTETTRNNTWYGITGYFLGTNLTRLPTVLLADHATAIGTAFTGDLGSVTNILSSDPLHLYGVIAAYCVLFLGVAYYLTWKRDVLQ